MTNTISVRIGGEQAEFIEIEVARRSHAGAIDYWDGNWLRTRISVAVGGFRGAFDADLRNEELEGFRVELAKLYKDLRGVATFHTMEGQVELRCDGDGRGHIEVQGEAKDVAGTGNALRFRIELDQTQIPPIIRQLDAIRKTYPVIDSPSA